MDKFRDERFFESDTAVVMKQDEPGDRSLAKVKRGMDHSAVFPIRSEKPVILKTIQVVERTRLPRLIIATALAGSIIAGTFYYFENSRLQRERQLAADRSREIVPRAGAIPEQNRQASEEAKRTAPTVRAVTAEADGRDVR